MSSSSFPGWDSMSSAEQADILASPALAAPNGTVSNLINPPNRNDIGIPVMATFFALVIITGLLRLYSRVFVVRNMKLEDYLGFTAYCWDVFAMVNGIYSTGALDLRHAHADDLVQWIWIYRLIYAVVMLFAKAAILLEWRHLFVPTRTRNWFFWATTAMIVVNTVAYGVAIIMTCRRCNPPKKIWQPWVDGTCADLYSQKSTDIATSYINLVMDIVILLLPQPVIWKLKLTKQRRIGVSLVFSLGVFVLVCAIGRIHSNTVMDYIANSTRGGAINMIWAYGEATFVMVVFASPGIPRAFTKQAWVVSLVSTFRSWTRLGDSTKGNSNGSVWARKTPPSWSIGGSNGKRRKPTQSDLDLMETRDAENLESGYNNYPSSVSELAKLPGDGTWNTAIIEMEESARFNASSARGLGQHGP
ncbi:hypothetical protein PFICI_11983 [Pestalotiopsis fici W106-1]|uniref:Rhodopsin domain-containing protein n=1 Tax=Pestalotiopsis fici (strain W106-1 / CGMCC3.15140) TaxID=1229662 RepID=W3WUQ5_PESFW|nr:uncharacterized protein PFICI_11983 [Pestalotiopsis fici W106-1]ETS76596.1 hypothetical protein PFICI_11983 [Pestalotiopsis fici W106-1]